MLRRNSRYCPCGKEKGESYGSGRGADAFCRDCQIKYGFRPKPAPVVYAPPPPPERRTCRGCKLYLLQKEYATDLALYCDRCVKKLKERRESQARLMSQINQSKGGVSGP